MESVPAPALEEARGDDLEEEVEKPIELVLLLDAKKAFSHDTAAATAPKKDQRTLETVSEPNLKKDISDQDLSSLKTSADSTPPRAPLSSDRRADQPTEFDEEEGFAGGRVLEDKTVVPAEERIRAVVQQNSGRIIQVNYHKQSNVPESMLVEIPSSHIRSFYSHLAQLGHIKTSLPAIGETPTKLLRVNIHLISNP
jgi:hypothetical protein